jgi:hypothetical protein
MTPDTESTLVSRPPAAGADVRAMHRRAPANAGAQGYTRGACGSGLLLSQEHGERGAR